MKAKHPQCPPPIITSDPPSSPVQFSDVEVISALRSFPSNSAPGPSSLRANHLKEAVFCPSPTVASRALVYLVEVVNILAAGLAPPLISPFLCAASLLAPKKKDGGLRPIAVGEVLRRLTSKCVSRAVQPEAISILSPLQVGVGIPVGCESIVHSVSSLLADPAISPGRKSCLFVDFSNAFNSVDREAMFQELRSRIPSISAWVKFSYGSQPFLFFGDFQLLSCTGVHQGDPLGPLCFALTLHPLIEQIQSSVPDLRLNAWYLDDGSLCGPPASLFSALEIIGTAGPPRGLHLNKNKCLFSVLNEASFDLGSFPAGIPITLDGFTLLGCPIGPPSFCLDSIFKRISKVQSILARLPDLHDSQIECSLLRSCLSLPKIAFALRTCPPDFIYPALTAFDNLIREALSQLVGSPLSNWSWSKASLPSSLGGINLRQAVLHAPAAYIGSLVQSRPLVTEILGFQPSYPTSLSSAIKALSSTLGHPEWSVLSDIEPPLCQRSLSLAIDLSGHCLLLESAPDTRFKALAQSSAIRHAGDWLNVIPSSALGLHMFDQEFRLCLRYWLGLPLFPVDLHLPSLSLIC